MKQYDMNCDPTEPRVHNWKGKTAECESREFKMALLALPCGPPATPITASLTMRSLKYSPAFAVAFSQFVQRQAPLVTGSSSVQIAAMISN
jgi:hypothetical protein